MGENILVAIVGVLVLGVLAQWISWRLKIPSILLLLLFGFLAGPVGGFVNPDEVLGNLLFPVVSLSVAIILFEGGLGLKYLSTPDSRKVTFRLVTLGLAATWIVAAAAAYFVLGLEARIAVLLGAVLTVSGPTVIMPLLRSVRPKGAIGDLLKWEGILIDPAGALVSVLVFEAILAQDLGDAPIAIFSGVIQTAVIGTIFGLLGAIIITFLFRRHLLPDYLQNPFALTMVVSVHVASNHFYHESGLLAVTLMAIVLANTKGISLRHVLDFKEDLTNLIVSSLFILLSARIPLANLLELDWIRCALFLLLLIFVARPLAVFCSTINAGLSFKEKLFLSAVAPRGIIAAAVSSVFAFELTAVGHPGAELLVSYTFVVIIGTVVLYGLSARPIARLLDLGEGDSQGVLLVGASSFAKKFACELNKNDIETLIVDSNIHNVRAARFSGLRAHSGSILADDLLDEINLSGIGKFAALTANAEVNALAALRFGEVFDRSKVYQLAEESDAAENHDSSTAHRLRGRYLFDKQITFGFLENEFRNNGEILTIDLPDSFSKDDSLIDHKTVIPLAILSNSKTLELLSADLPFVPKKGQKLIVLSLPKNKELQNGK